MAYIGNTVQNQGFAPAVDYFNGDGTTVTFTLSRPVASVAQLTAVIDNVIQNPSSAFTVSGNAITFTSAPLSGTNNIWVEYTSLVTTYAAISQDPSVIGDITASGGYLAVGDFGNTYIDGTIVDYVTGNARITTGPADGLTIYNGGTTARTALAAWDTSGNLTNAGTINTLNVGRGGGNVVYNTAVGAGTLGSSSQTGAYNAFFGLNCASANTTGSYNCAYGAYTLNTNTTGSSNTAYGQAALYSNLTGSYNTAVGHQAGYSTTTGGQNVFIGYQAGYSNTAYNQNTIIGFQAGYYNVNGNLNTFLGWQAGFSYNPSTPNTNGLNCFLGYYSGYGVTTGAQNTFIGGNASGYQMTTGNYNTILGNFSGNGSGLDIRTASNYIVISDGAGNPRIISNGSGEISMNTTPATGYTLTLKGAASGAQGILYGVNAGDTFTVRIQGDGSIYNYYGTYGTISDARLKENIVDATSKLDDLMQVKIRNYNLIDDESKTKQIGVIAQELETVFPNMVTEDEDGNKAVKSAVFVPMLIKAIQELNAKVTALEAKLESK